MSYNKLQELCSSLQLLTDDDSIIIHDARLSFAVFTFNKIEENYTVYVIHV